MCQNEGTRNETTCTCDCADGYSGDNCGSECIMCHIDSCSLLFMGYEQSLKHISMGICLLLHLHFLTACSRTCQNGGTLSETTCTCDCAGGFSGDNCGSECSYAFNTDRCWLYIHSQTVELAGLLNKIDLHASL